MGVGGKRHGPRGLGAQGARTKNDPPRTRTWNLRLRRPTPYPLGQRAMWRSPGCASPVSLTRLSPNQMLLRAHPSLNQGPADLQSAALTTELSTHWLPGDTGRTCVFPQPLGRECVFLVCSDPRRGAGAHFSRSPISFCVQPPPRGM